MERSVCLQELPPEAWRDLCLTGSAPRTPSIPMPSPTVVLRVSDTQGHHSESSSPPEVAAPLPHRDAKGPAHVTWPPKGSAKPMTLSQHTQPRAVPPPANHISAHSPADTARAIVMEAAVGVACLQRPGPTACPLRSTWHVGSVRPRPAEQAQEAEVGLSLIHISEPTRPKR